MPKPKKDLAKHAGTGHSGPNDIGTRPQDADLAPLRGLEDPDSPASRLWRDAGSARDDDHPDEPRPEERAPEYPDVPAKPPSGPQWTRHRA